MASVLKCVVRSCIQQRFPIKQTIKEFTNYRNLTDSLLERSPSCTQTLHFQLYSSDSKSPIRQYKEADIDDLFNDAPPSQNVDTDTSLIKNVETKKKSEDFPKISKIESRASDIDLHDGDTIDFGEESQLGKTKDNNRRGKFDNNFQSNRRYGDDDLQSNRRRNYGNDDDFQSNRRRNYGNDDVFQSNRRRNYGNDDGFQSNRRKNYGNDDDFQMNRGRRFDHDDDDLQSNRRRRYGNDEDFQSNRRKRYDNDEFQMNQGGRNNDFGGRRGSFGDFNAPSQDISSMDLPEIVKKPYIPSENIANRSKEDVKSFRNEHDMNLIGGDIPDPIIHLDDYDFPDHVKHYMAKDGITAPTPIQAQTWPIAFSGDDFIGISQTGSGKTLAFLLPAVVHILNQPNQHRGDGPIALILAPTRELATQIHTVAKRYRHNNCKPCVLYGGAKRGYQAMDLQKSPEIVVATPGRLNDFLNTNETNLQKCSYLVLDEADRMLDMGFEPQLRQILKYARPDRQTLMFSATWPKEVQQLARSFLNNHKQLNVGSTELQANPDIQQNIHVCRGNRDMNTKLYDILEQVSDGKVLLFMNTKRECDRMEANIRRNFQDLNARAIHGDKTQPMRERTLKLFRGGNINMLIATEVAARGIDVSDITHVINYGFPNDCEQYVHRIGRTGRQGKSGIAHTLISDLDRKNCRGLIDILKKANQKITPELNYFR